MASWKCSSCGYIWKGALSAYYRCPVCNQPACKFVKVKEGPDKSEKDDAESRKSAD